MKRILVIATGGTIASVAQGEGGALAPGISGEELMERVPLIGGLCELEVEQLMNIDSTNMRPRGWLAMARCIRERYDAYDGFVVLHGTDTMAYSAAALSYLVQGSRKPIVLTGSQQPMAAPFTDAKLNLYHSLLWATDPAASDVHVVFGGQVIVGTRAHKQRTMSFNAFTSVNWPLPAIIRGERVVRDAGPGMSLGAVYARGAARPSFYERLDERVAVLKLTPGLDGAILEALASSCNALVLETFGIGGIPDALARPLLAWADAGNTLVLTTQVPEEGLDLGVYEVGRAFADHPGVLRAADMTIEATVAKTMWALGNADSPAAVDELFYRVVNHDRVSRA